MQRAVVLALQHAMVVGLQLVVVGSVVEDHLQYTPQSLPMPLALQLGPPALQATSMRMSLTRSGVKIASVLKL